MFYNERNEKHFLWEFVHNRISQFLLHFIPLLYCLSNSAIAPFHLNSKCLPPFQIFLCYPVTWLITMDCKNFRVVILWRLTALPHNSLLSQLSFPCLQNSPTYFLNNYTICENLKIHANLKSFEWRCKIYAFWFLMNNAIRNCKYIQPIYQ